MAQEVKSPSLKIQDRQGSLQYKAFTANTEDSFTVSSPVLIHEVVFFASGAALTTGWVKIRAEGQALFGGAQVPILSLQAAVMANTQQPAQYGVVIWRPHRPILVTQSHPLVFELNVAQGITLRGESV